MTTDPKFAVFTRSGPIWAVGNTLEEAYAEAVEWLEDREDGEPWTAEAVKAEAIPDQRHGFTHDLCVGECSDALAAQVESEGGDVVFEVVQAFGNWCGLRIEQPGEAEDRAAEKALTDARARLEKAQLALSTREKPRDSQAFALWMKICEWLNPNRDVPPSQEWLNDAEAAEEMADAAERLADELPAADRGAAGRLKQTPQY